MTFDRRLTTIRFTGFDTTFCRALLLLPLSLSPPSCSSSRIENNSTQDHHSVQDLYLFEFRTPPAPNMPDAPIWKKKVDQFSPPLHKRKGRAWEARTYNYGNVACACSDIEMCPEGEGQQREKSTKHVNGHEGHGYALGRGTHKNGDIRKSLATKNTVAEGKKKSLPLTSPNFQISTY